MFKFVHNRIIEITYQRKNKNKNKNKKRRIREMAMVLVTTKDLRRSSRMSGLNEGHKQQMISGI